MPYTLETKKFEQNMKRYEEDLHTDIKSVLKKSSVVYGERASRYVPPMVNGKWSKTIPAKMYKRDFILPLSYLVKSDTTNRKLFSEKLRQGFRFAVKGRLRGKIHWWFATTLRKTVQYTRIFNRGLFKFLFGANFGSIGEKTPMFFQKLLQKSPNMAKHISEHVLELKSEPREEAIRIANLAFDNDRFSRESKYRGEQAAKTYMKKAFKTQVQDKKVQV